MSQPGTTAPDPGRRAFLRGRLRRREVIRPPWALPEADFLARCTRCGECVATCQERILVNGDGGYPEVDFSRGGCALCGDCALRCRSQAFRGEPRNDMDAWTHRVVINSHCMALKGVVCRTCGDVCDVRAIRFQLKLGGVSTPILDSSTCSGCGECVALCPARAISVEDTISTPEPV